MFEKLAFTLILMHIECGYLSVPTLRKDMLSSRLNMIDIEEDSESQKAREELGRLKTRLKRLNEVPLRQKPNTEAIKKMLEEIRRERAYKELRQT